MIFQAMREATEYERKEAAMDDAQTLAKTREYAAKSASLTIHELNAEQKVAWAKAMEVIYPNFYKVIGEDLIKKVQAVH